ncbi:MAG: Fe-S cluster assembly protein SufD [Acetobacteraceae bacterium]|nr:Fe-S cluster assembly protein SufD [Acetobacteraceae bacterium]
MSTTAPPSGPVAALNAAAAAFIARYNDSKARLPGDTHARAEAAALLAEHGLPGPREEAWRYTSLRPFAETPFAPSVPAEPPASLLARIPAIEGTRLVFVDGRFHSELSGVPRGIRVTTGEPALGRIARPATEKLVALNTMLAEDGAAIHVPAGIDGGTIILVSIATGHSIGFHPRHAVVLAAGAKLTVLDLALGDGEYLHNPVISFEIAEGATASHLRIQDEGEGAFHLSTAYAEVAADATYDSFALTLGARLARMEVHARLAGERAAAHLNAAQLLGNTRSGDGQHADFTTVVAHDAPNTASRQTVKNVLTGRSRGVFQGKIEVARIAQKTDGYQMNQALLLSAEAEMNSKPQLEIYADDVKCSHGATVGALDGDQLFYLRSRGVPEAEARAILVRAFLSEALDPIGHDQARGAMEAAIAGWWDRHTI